ncbi:MAG: MarR family transcriptional regulator [Devosia sp.]|uniref:bifunctional helix-turn-helix transcriptional regulator/GNAT family N-acetyltransferase n=1 Tax=Devosia sp. TaxID=1871048 RepID=UPI0024CB02E8|nr:helix-turn-helix domain-containing GNAT family N-acetyltransferase [Devosia sp.]UYN99346.1 MAG: MarR family transcriptional regulator [Devosia sp.]
MADPADVAQIRSFNRFYTGVIGLLDEGMHETMHSLAEARVIYELGKAGVTTGAQVAAALDMDRGQMSRLMTRLIGQGLVAQLPRGGDGRASPVGLTPEGRAVAARFDAMSDEVAARTLLDPLTPFEQADMIGSMRRILAMLAEPDDAPMILRPHRVGELGWLIHRQGLLYHLEQGWTGEFEALIAKIYAEFEQTPPSPRKSLWVADIGGVVAGSVFVVPASDAPERTAQLRALYVEPMFRGRGVGKQLVRQAVSFAKGAGHHRIMLWTQSCLVSARRIYETAGFKLTSTEPHHSFGADLVGEHWLLEL